jgi:CRP-like cAMP-binding protein
MTADLDRARLVRSPAPMGRPKNRLLAALPPEDFHRLAPFLHTVPMRLKQVLYKTGQPLRDVYFPNGGVVSIAATLLDGTTMEAVTVGDEGMVGIEAFLTDTAVAPGDAVIQVPDTDAERMSVQDFCRETAAPGAFRERIARYLQVVIAQLMQTAACNAMHDVQERCARWLLMTHDRMHEHEFQLSQETLAGMLGVQRPTVSVVAETLQAAGLIRYSYAHVTVLDRHGLEATACECYLAIRAHFDRLQS